MAANIFDESCEVEESKRRGEFVRLQLRNRGFTAFTCNDEATEWKEIPLGDNLSRCFGLRQKQQKQSS